jgi:hypothetical protein
MVKGNREWKIEGDHGSSDFEGRNRKQKNSHSENTEEHPQVATQDGGETATTETSSKEAWRSA